MLIILQKTQLAISYLSVYSSFALCFALVAFLTKDEHNFISRMLYKNIYCPIMNEERGPPIGGLDSLVVFSLVL